MHLFHADVGAEGEELVALANQAAVVAQPRGAVAKQAHDSADPIEFGARS